MFRGLAVDPFYYWLKILSLFLLHLFFIIAFKFLLKFKNGLRGGEVFNLCSKHFQKANKQNLDWNKIDIQISLNKYHQIVYVEVRPHSQWTITILIIIPQIMWLQRVAERFCKSLFIVSLFVNLFVTGLSLKWMEFQSLGKRYHIILRLPSSLN